MLTKSGPIYINKRTNFIPLPSPFLFRQNNEKSYLLGSKLNSRKNAINSVLMQCVLKKVTSFVKYVRMSRLSPAKLLGCFCSPHDKYLARPGLSMLPQKTCPTFMSPSCRHKRLHGLMCVALRHCRQRIGPLSNDGTLLIHSNIKKAII